MFTRYDFYKGMFCELGGELVDTDHEELQALGKELGVETQKLPTRATARTSSTSRDNSIFRRT